MKTHDANVNEVYQNSVAFLHSLVAKSHSGTPHTEFSGQEEMEAGRQESLYQT